jgi:hypothetical protein
LASRLSFFWLIALALSIRAGMLSFLTGSKISVFVLASTGMLEGLAGPSATEKFDDDDH